MASGLNYNEIANEDLLHEYKRVVVQENREKGLHKSSWYASYNRDKDGYIAPKDHEAKHKPYSVQ